MWHDVRMNVGTRIVVLGHSFFLWGCCNREANSCAKTTDKHINVGGGVKENVARKI